MPDAPYQHFRDRLDTAQGLIERMCRSIELAAAKGGEADPALALWRETLWGTKDSASSAIAKLQQIQARWAEIELELLKFVEDRPATDEEPVRLEDLDLDLLETELARLRATRPEPMEANSDTPPVQPFRRSRHDPTLAAGLTPDSEEP